MTPFRFWTACIRAGRFSKRRRTANHSRYGAFSAQIRFFIKGASLQRLRLRLPQRHLCVAGHPPRRRKVRLPLFPPAAKTSSAPLPLLFPRKQSLRGSPLQATGSSVPFIPASPAPPATAPSLRRWASASSAQSPLAFVSACGENIVRSLAPPLPTQTKFAREPSSGDWLLSSFYSSVSSSACHSAIFASLGIRQSPRGERATEPTLGPSGTQLRLNCWLKKRR